jgi:hypothetical protein
MMNSSQSEDALLSATQNQKLIVSRVFYIYSAVYILGVGTGLAVYHFCLV